MKAGLRETSTSRTDTRSWSRQFRCVGGAADSELRHPDRQSSEVSVSKRRPQAEEGTVGRPYPALMSYLEEMAAPKRPDRPYDNLKAGHQLSARRGRWGSRGPLGRNHVTHEDFGCQAVAFNTSDLATPRRVEVGGGPRGGWRSAKVTLCRRPDIAFGQVPETGATT